MFQNIKEIVSASDTTGYHQAFFHKNGIPALPAPGRWADASMASGTPSFNSYPGAPLEATPLSGYGNKGIYLGPGSSTNGGAKMISKANVQMVDGARIPMHIIFADYLMFYSSIDCDSTDLQTFDNTAALPRYSSGANNRLTFVCTTPMTSPGFATINYTDDNDIDQTKTIVIAASNTNGICVNTTATSTVFSTPVYSPFAPLNGSGIKKLNSIQFQTSVGGFISAVIVHPLSQINIRDNTASNEHDYLTQKMSMAKVQNEAYVNFFLSHNGTAGSSVVRGYLDLIWR